MLTGSRTTYYHPTNRNDLHLARHRFRRNILLRNLYRHSAERLVVLAHDHLACCCDIGVLCHQSGRDSTRFEGDQTTK